MVVLKVVTTVVFMVVSRAVFTDAPTLQRKGIRVGLGSLLPFKLLFCWPKQSNFAATMLVNQLSLPNEGFESRTLSNIY